MTVIDDLHDRFPELDDEAVSAADAHQILTGHGVTDDVIAEYLHERRAAGGLVREAHRSYWRGVESQ